VSEDERVFHVSIALKSKYLGVLFIVLTETNPVQKQKLVSMILSYYSCLMYLHI
jgi:hypothetical protein